MHKMFFWCEITPWLSDNFPPAPPSSNDTDAHNKYANAIKKCIHRLLRPLISMIFMIIMLHEELFFFSHVYVLEENLWSSLLWSKEHSEHNLHDFLPVFIL